MIYIVRNGYQGNGRVSCIVEAATEIDAARIAQAVFKHQDMQRREQHRSGPEYWQIETVQPITLPFVCEVD